MKLFEVVYDESSCRKSVYFCGLRVYHKKNRLKAMCNELELVKAQLNLTTDIVYSTHKISELPPTVGNKRKIQKQALFLLDMVDRICAEHGLKYWLDFGSLIGAVRHNGFVPWDDDVDISMLRSDYEKFLSVFPPKLEHEGMSFYLREKLKNHFQMRLCRVDDESIGLDIFPVDEFSIADRPEAKTNIERRIKQAYPLVTQLSKEMRPDADMVDLRRQLLRIHTEVLDKHIDESGEKMLMYGIDYPHTHPECVTTRDTIFPLRQGEFEGKLYWIPNKAEEHLSCLYGDWMSYPRFI